MIAWDIDNDLNTLEIKDATLEDSGEYTIEAVSELGTVQTTVVVRVQEQPNDVSEAVCIEETSLQEPTEAAESDEKLAELTVVPEIVIQPEDVKATPGETIKLLCKIKGWKLHVLVRFDRLHGLSITTMYKANQHSFILIVVSHINDLSDCYFLNIYNNFIDFGIIVYKIYMYIIARWPNSILCFIPYMYS